ncbi:MAG: hypothetical protein K0U47_10610 [Epsilonproteobacteria bacterium]|nr:hypothetical protein [Campylobacterota bacterium]
MIKTKRIKYGTKSEPSQKSKKREQQAYLAVQAVESLLKEIETLTKTPDEMEKRLQVLSTFVNTYVSKNDNSRFQNLNAFEAYRKFIINSRDEKVRREIEKNRANKIKYTDFEEEILFSYYEKGESNETIAKRIKARGVKCNRESIRQFIIKKRKEQA